MHFTSVNPATGNDIHSHPAATSDQARTAIRAAGRRWESWRRHSFEERAAPLRTLARLLRSDAEAHARLMAEEMGKPLEQGRGEVEKCAWVCDFYAERAEDFLQDEPASTEALRSYVAYRPLGPVLAVMPWNFPYWQVLRFAAPTVMAGNVVLLKHASNVPGCALRLEALFREAGFPEGVFQTLLMDRKQTARVIRHRGIRAVTLTGSVAAGRSVAKEAGAKLKKSVLELGGSDPYLILEDADIEAAAEACAHSRLINSGQSCIAAKRAVVVEVVREAFEEALVRHMAAARMGDPLDPEVDVGPLARDDLRSDLHQQVTRSMEKGARCLLGGEIPEGPGFFYPPTVLTDVRRGMPAYGEEVFGPVAAILPVRDRQGAIRVANDTPFGLGAAVFTRDVEEGERIAREEIMAGSCFVNTFVRSDPRLPFGGIGESGYGRELGRQGILEFVNTKTVYVA